MWNHVTIAVGSRTSGDIACADAPDMPVVGISKEVVAQQQQADGTWLVDYQLTAANPSPSTTANYSITDTFALGDGIVLAEAPTIENAPAGVTPVPSWDGAGNSVLAEEIALPGGGSHTYTVRAVIDAGAVRGGDEAGDCVLQTGETGSGFANTATATSGTVARTAEACVTAFDPGVVKTVDGVPVRQPDGSWVLHYFIAVSNPSDTTALTYELRMSSASRPAP